MTLDTLGLITRLAINQANNNKRKFMSKRAEAGEFSEWISDFTLTMKGQSEGNVPCNGCVGCCTSSKFILIRPSDTGALEVIPEQLLFSAPSLPPNHYLMGYDKKGHCPMFKNGACTIYQYRPETCRQYDCRVLKASDADTRDEGPSISKKSG
ncbi:hypothetical protein CS022_01845 [Veronia nyctiphanis]|uniref:YkgJ family cysteine cluster protein n=2 Tax=Veronia nyctiphanis TaxID=1278244 RepID=A0A4Q0YUI0_9GAMM|nr:hypothetical protein CS022_01845 [Veronia nyctiphanis]